MYTLIIIKYFYFLSSQSITMSGNIINFEQNKNLKERLLQQKQRNI